MERAWGNDEGVLNYDEGHVPADVQDAITWQWRFQRFETAIRSQADYERLFEEDSEFTYHISSEGPGGVVIPGTVWVIVDTPYKRTVATFLCELADPDAGSTCKDGQDIEGSCVAAECEYQRGGSGWQGMYGYPDSNCENAWKYPPEPDPGEEDDIQ